MDEITIAIIITRCIKYKEQLQFVGVLNYE